MTDEEKKKEVSKLAEVINSWVNNVTINAFDGTTEHNLYNVEDLSVAICNAGYKNVPDDCVVLLRREYEEMKWCNSISAVSRAREERADEIKNLEQEYDRILQVNQHYVMENERLKVENARLAEENITLNMQVKALIESIGENHEGTHEGEKSVLITADRYNELCEIEQHGVIKIYNVREICRKEIAQEIYKKIIRGLKQERGDCSLLLYATKENPYYVGKFNGLQAIFEFIDNLFKKEYGIESEE